MLCCGWLVCRNNFAAAYSKIALFKSETALRSHLVRPKDAVEPNKQDGVVYKIPCECGEVCIGDTAQNNIIETSDWLVPRPPQFLSTSATLDISHSGTK